MSRLFPQSRPPVFLYVFYTLIMKFQQIFELPELPAVADGEPTPGNTRRPVQNSRRAREQSHEGLWPARAGP